MPLLWTCVAGKSLYLPNLLIKSLHARRFLVLSVYLPLQLVFLGKEGEVESHILIKRPIRTVVE